MTTHHMFDLDWTPEGVVFDCDGTLVDSEQHWQEARFIVLRDAGCAPDEEFAEHAKGLHYTECGALMARLAGRPDGAEEMTRHLLETFRALAARRPVAMRGARDLVAELSRVAPLAVASNCPADVVEFCLESVGLRHHFRHLVVPGGPVRPKPHPDTYAEAVRRLGVKPGDALAVEDSVNGLRAAAGAGLRVVGVGPRPGPEAAALADLWVGGLDNPGLAAWAASRPTDLRPEAGRGAPRSAPSAPTVPRPGGPTRSGTTTSP
ncbi:HAD family phosphatase [Streptomyces sp. NPDC046831]|uniref:HAD family hydrolase n=1 Tax=Streptomyces sp. NPDC046831 TaxID=3154805 RepID=UPI0033D27064